MNTALTIQALFQIRFPVILYDADFHLRKKPNLNEKQLKPVVEYCYCVLVQYLRIKVFEPTSCFQQYTDRYLETILKRTFVDNGYRNWQSLRVSIDQLLQTDLKGLYLKIRKIYLE